MSTNDAAPDDPIPIAYVKEDQITDGQASDGQIPDDQIFDNPAPNFSAPDGYGPADAPAPVAPSEPFSSLDLEVDADDAYALGPPPSVGAGPSAPPAPPAAETPLQKKPSNPVPAACGWSALTAVLFIPLVVPGFGEWIRPIGTEGWGDWLAIDEKRSLNITFFDLFIALAALIRFAADARGGWSCLIGGIKRWAACVWPAFILFAAAAASLAPWPPESEDAWRRPDLDAKLAIKTLLQWATYFLLVPYVLGPLWRSPKWRGRLYAALGMGWSFAAFWAWKGAPWLELYAGQGIPHETGGLLGNRHTYTAAIGLALVLLAGGATERWLGGMAGFWRAVALGMAAAAYLGPSLSLGLLLSAALGLAVAWTAAGRWSGAMLLPLAAWLAWGVPSAATTIGSIQRILTFHPAEEPAPLPLYEEAVAQHHLILSRSIQPWRDDGGAQQADMTRRYRRWSAELNMWRESPITGVGLGQYQACLGDFMPTAVERALTDDPAYYDTLIDEPFTHGQHLKIAAELGLGGLLAWVWMMAVIMARALGRMGPDGRVRCLHASGVLGACLVVILGGIWTEWFVRGAGPMFGLLLSLSGTVDENSREPF